MHTDPFLQALPAGTELPDAVRALHSTCAQYSGRCTVTAGGGKLVALALRCARMPPDGQDVEVKVSIAKDQTGWIWTRNFGGHITQSRLNFDHRFDCVREQFGPVSIWLKPVFRRIAWLCRFSGSSFLGFHVPSFYCRAQRPLNGRMKEAASGSMCQPRCRFWAL